MTNSEHTAIEHYVNMPELLARVEDDRELLAELLALFLKDYPKLRDVLHHAIDSGDACQVEKAAHALKGMLANLSIKNGAELVATVETAARARDERQIQQAIAAFDREDTGLLAAVGKFMVGGEP
jgi:HPt (histidine-containing phosphotransfer) domain-containing protein